MTKRNRNKPPKIETLFLPEIYRGNNGNVTNEELIKYALSEEERTNLLTCENILLKGAQKEKYAGCAANLMRFYTRQRWHREARKFFYSQPKNKNNVTVRLNLGINLYSHGKIDEAIENFNYCRSKHPANAEVLCHLARCYGAKGDTNRASKLFEAATKLNPTNIVGLREMSVLCKPRELSKYRKLLSTVLKQPGLHENQQVECLFGLAKTFMRTNDTESEINLLGKANKLAKKNYKGPDYQTERILHRQTVEDLCEKAIHKPIPKSLEKDVVLIACLPRAGASLLERKISEEFGLCQTGENDLFNSSTIEFVRQGHSLNNSTIDVDGTQHLQFDYTELLASPNMEAFIDCYNFILNDIAEGRSGVINKSLANAWQAPILMKLAKNVKTLNLRRDPRDLAISALQAHFDTGHGYIYSAADLESQIQHHEAMVSSWLGQFPDRVLSLSYEDFVSDTEQWLNKIGSFLNIEPKNTVEKNSVTVTSSIWQVQSEIHQASIAKWKKYEPLLEGCFGTGRTNNDLKN